MAKPTEDQVRREGPGEILDVWVERFVLGRRVARLRYPAGSYDRDVWLSLAEIREGDESVELLVRTIPEYSADPGAAWGLVDFCARGKLSALPIGVTGADIANKRFVASTLDNHASAPIIVYGDSLPHALARCAVLAALRADGSAG